MTRAAVHLTETPQDRDPRRPLDVAGTLRDDSGRPLDVIVEDISSTGCLIRLDPGLAIGQRLRIGLPGVTPVEAVVVRRQDDGHGCHFLRPIGSAEVERAGGVATVVSASFGDPAIRPPVAAADCPLAGAMRLTAIFGASLGLWTMLAAIGWRFV